MDKELHELNKRLEEKEVLIHILGFWLTWKIIGAILHNIRFCF